MLCVLTIFLLHFSSVTTALSAASTTVIIPSSMVPTHSSERGLSVYVLVGVCGAVLVLLAATTIAISVMVCIHQKRKNEPVTTADNVAYGVNPNEMEMSGNVSYIATSVGERTSTKDDEDANEETLVYDYVSTSAGNDVIALASNAAYVMPCEVPVSANQAYGITES